MTDVATIQLSKDKPFSYRTLSLVNPYLYYLLVREITNEENWKSIQSRMKKLEVRWIERLAIPGKKIDSDSLNTEKGELILDWWEHFEQRSLELSMKYKFMLCTDITDCYPSIYTHSIAWSLCGRDVAKQERKEKSRRESKLGDDIDYYIRAMQSGETMGIPQGSKLFDFVAELVLADADNRLEKELKDREITGIHILRYRDDYRIFSNSLDDLREVSLALHQVLDECHLRLNEAKTFMSEIPLIDSIKKDKRALVDRGLLERDYTKTSIQKQLLAIRIFADEFPNSGSVIRLLDKTLDRVKERKGDKEDPKVLIAIIVDILLKNMKHAPMLIAMLSHLMLGLEKESQKEILQDISNRLKPYAPKVEYIEIWLAYLYRMHGMKDEIKGFAESSLCSFLAGEGETSDIWDLSWLQEEYRKNFPLDSIVSQNALPTSASPISPREIRIFHSSNY